MFEDLSQLNQPVNARCTFCAILEGEEPGNIIARDQERGFALIESIHPEGAIHWLAVPFEHVDSTAQLRASNQERFLRLLQFAIESTQGQVAAYPELLANGFTVKFHLGAFETVQHAKLHILSTE